MKKIIFFVCAILLLGGINLLLPTKTFARCDPQTNFSCPGSQVSCNVPSEGLFCCDNQSQCSNIDGTVTDVDIEPAPVPTPFVPSGINCRSAAVSCVGTESPCNYKGFFYCCTTSNDCLALRGLAPSDGSNNDDAELWCDAAETQLRTAIGCVPILSSNEEFLSFILRWAVGIGGGIAFLLIVYAGFMIMTSAGNPERLKAGQELLTSAISGLILLIFSVVILKIIGVDILGLDKFGFGK